MKARTIAAAASAIALTALTACGTQHAGSAGLAHGSGVAAVPGVSSALANPTVGADLTAAEQQLLTNLKANFNAMHPITSMETAVRVTYPKGDTAKIVDHAVTTFTLSVMHTSGPGSARDLWLQGVDTYAQSLGAHAVPAATR